MQNRLTRSQDPDSQAGRQTVRLLWWMVFRVETLKKAEERG